MTARTRAAFALNLRRQKAQLNRAFWHQHHAISATQASGEIRDPVAQNSGSVLNHCVAGHSDGDLIASKVVKMNIIIH
jgi:hypothetical protein